ncbi:MAG: amidohydrolase family protein [Actinomycetota bacterium]
MREQRLTVMQALEALTVHGAYGVLAEDDLGMLRAGMLADIVVLSEDPREVPRAELERIDVAMVFVGRREREVGVPQPTDSALVNDLAEVGVDGRAGCT